MGEKFELNHYYLVKRTHHSPIFLAKILFVTGKAFYIQWNNDACTWEDRKEFLEYVVVEDITTVADKIPFQNKKESKIEYESCGYCSGTGYVLDDKQTAGSKPCPVCFGSKTILKSIEIVG